MNTQSSYCDQCGQNQSPSVRFCGNCGAPANGNRPSPGELRESPSPKHSGQSPPDRNMLTIALGVMGFLVCGPFTSIPGALMAWSDLSNAKQAGVESTGTIRLSLGINIAATAFFFVSVAGMMLLMVLAMGL